jgi:four helix bundle protein
MRVHDYKKLLVWQKSMELVTTIYKFTDEFPKSESYGIVSQMRRAAVSIPSNIAEGSRRGTKKDFSHFLITAMGSGSELETQIQIAKNLEFNSKGDSKELESSLEEILKMLNKLI